jgi:Tol biopolymer transport system component
MKTKIRRKTFLNLTAGFAAFLAIATGHAKGPEFELVSTIAFTSSRDDPTNSFPILAAGEIYLMNEDGTNLRRLTENMVGDFFAGLSPDGKKIVFDSNRLRLPTEPRNTSDLFLMDPDGAYQTYLTRGSSATWSPDSKNIAFHASASGTGLPIKPDPGAATSDSDIFVANIDDLLAGVAAPQNITNSPDAIDDDADWSPDGTKIAFTSHPTSDDPINSSHAEIYVINPDGTGLTRLTFNNYEERAPSWSPDGSRIVFMASVGTHPGTPGQKFEICVMNADGMNFVQLTDNAVFDGTPTFSPDGQKILFHRTMPPPPMTTERQTQQLWMMNADGTGQMQLTVPPGFNNLANWGVLRVHVH